MGNTQQAGIKKDDHGGCSREQQPQATSVAPDRLRAGVNGDDHGGCSQPQQVVHPVQFRAGAADRARNQMQPLGGGHDVGTTSTLRNGKKNSATDGEGLSSRIDILGPAGESVILGNDQPPKPEGVKFVVLHTLPIKSGCIGDGDGFTAYVKKAVDVAASGSYKKGDTNNRAPQQYRIRMRGIDAPEMKMEHGVESRNELVKLIGGKCVTIHVYGTDQYGRYLGDIYCDDIFIQEEMLKRGFAWYFRAGEERPQLARWEREAREARQGLWSSDNPQKPWEWKRDNPRNNKKENANDVQVESQSQGNVSTESLPCMISSCGKRNWKILWPTTWNKIIISRS
uniref:Uncharacterized protein n=1 Tax=Avena sativa TaxID=4498 RepID=A0ACD5UX48_AVESA